MLRKTLAALLVIGPFLVAPALAALYGAIAYSPKTGRYGDSYNYLYLGDAENDAIANCDAPDATVVAWCWNEWAALAVADDGSYGYSSGPSEAAAEAAALSNCTGPNRRTFFVGFIPARIENARYDGAVGEAVAEFVRIRGVGGATKRRNSHEFRYKRALSC